MCTLLHWFDLPAVRNPVPNKGKQTVSPNKGKSLINISETVVSVYVAICAAR